MEQDRIQELKRSIMRRLDKIEDEILLQSILETLEDFEAEQEQEDEEAETLGSRDRSDNKTIPPPINKHLRNDADSWLDGLGR
jgi:hypothetical protein